jgi:hypothetical protein
MSLAIRAADIFGDDGDVTEEERITSDFAEEVVA